MEEFNKLYRHVFSDAAFFHIPSLFWLVFSPLLYNVLMFISVMLVYYIIIFIGHSCKDAILYVCMYIQDILMCTYMYLHIPHVYTSSLSLYI